jgi:hypothetical protein
MIDNKSPHILSTASNLLGFSFIVFTTIHGMGLAGATFIDEITAFLIVLLAVSCTYSFASIRATEYKKAKRFETVAEYFFMTSLLLITATSILTVLDYLTLTHS